MEFRVLGPLEVSDGAGALPLERAGLRSLLALLLLHRNESVSTARLVDELWPERPPATAAKIVQLYVSQLRKVIGAARLATTATGYVLRTESDEVDAERFERLVEQASGRDPAAARALLGEALALWRGPAFGELADAPFARWEAERLDELRLSAREEEIDCELELGRHAAVAAALPRLIREHPLRERLRGQLMLALYRAGRQADALEAYRQARQSLVDELGLEPSPPLQRLEAAILRHDPALDLALPQPGPTRAAEAPPAGESKASVPATRRRRSRAVLAAVAGAGALAVAAGAAGYLATRSTPVLRTLPNSVGVVDPHTNRLTAVIPVGNAPSAVDVGSGAVWVVNGGDKTVSRIDPTTSTVVRTIGSVGSVTDVAPTRDGVWVGSAAHELRRVDAGSNLVVERVRLPTSTNPLRRDDWPSTVASGPAGVWATTVGGVARIAPGPRVTLPLRNIPCCTAVAVGAGAVWVTEDYGVVRIAPRSRVLTSTRLSFAAGSIAAGKEGVWLTEQDKDAVWRLDPRTGQVVRTIVVGAHPAGVALGGGSVWVVTTGGTVARIDPRAERVVRRIRLGGTPRAVAYGLGRLWVGVD